MTDVPNQTKWHKVFQNTASDLLATVTPANLQGIIPVPHNATRVMACGRAKDQITVVYPVGGAVKLFISSAWVSIANDDGDINDVKALYWRDGDDLNNEYLFYMFIHENGALTISNSYYPAKEVPAGYDICSESTKTSIYIRSGFSGWLEDV